MHSLDGTWRKSTYTQDHSIEARRTEAGVEIRDTENHSAVQVFDVESWRAFIDGAKDGEFDVG